MSLITIKQIGHELRVNSRVIAEMLGNQHKNVLALLSRYQSDFEEFGIIAFQTRKSKRGMPTRFALLNRSQAELLLTYSDNTPESRRLKIGLIKAFDQARNALEASSHYLPFYHAAHENLQKLVVRSGSTTPARTHHMNLEKLINKTFGMNAGTRQTQPAEVRLMIGAAMALANRVYKQAQVDDKDHKHAYQIVKHQLQKHVTLLSGRMIGEPPHEQL